MWADELFSLAIAKYHPLLPEHGQPLYRRTDVHHIADDDTFLTAKAAEQSPPLNDLLEKASVNLLGATELAARLPAALAGCVLLLWFAVFAWRHPDPCVRRVLRWSVLLLTVHPALVQYAQEGRSYSVGVSLVGMAGLLWMLRWREGWRNWTPPSWTEISLMILACYSHYNAAILVILMLFADSVMAMKLRSSQAWWRLIVLGLGFLIWLALNSHTIVFTSNGGVAWFQESAWDHWLRTLEAFPAIVQPLWLSFVASVLIGLVLIRLGQGQPIWHKKGAIRLLALAGMTSMYVLLVNQVTAKAGMSHPRYYIFILPFVIVMLGLVLAELTRAWLIVGAVLVLTVSAQPSAHILNTTNTDDFRSMSIASAKGSDKNTVFLYQLISNRDIYRVYLERFLGHDPRQQLIGISSLDEVPAICKQLEGRPHIAVLGHIYGKAEIDAVYANCGAQWPNRLKSQFQHTYSEHWTVK